MIESTRNTKLKIKLRDIANVFSGVYAKGTPTGVAVVSGEDINKSFTCKQATYLCEIFNFDIMAVPSTTLYAIRLRSNVVSPEYLRWYLNHPSVVATIKTAQAGSGTPLIHKPTLENLEVIVPDQRTQDLIVGLSFLQKREKEILEAIAMKRMQITNQILINELNK